MAEDYEVICKDGVCRIVPKRKKSKKKKKKD